MRTFCESKGIKLEIAVDKAPHQIQIAERNHDILLSTMRALMSFANAPYRLWANCIVWSCMLHNVSAVDYNTSVPIIPYHATDQPIDKNLLIPFVCLIIVHCDKDQVNDGKLDPRGLCGTFIGLADRFDFKKGIKVILPGDVIIETCFLYERYDVLPVASCRSNTFIERRHVWQRIGNELNFQGRSRL